MSVFIIISILSGILAGGIAAITAIMDGHDKPNTYVICWFIAGTLWPITIPVMIVFVVINIIYGAYKEWK